MESGLTRAMMVRFNPLRVASSIPTPATAPKGFGCFNPLRVASSIPTMSNEMEQGLPAPFQSAKSRVFDSHLRKAATQRLKKSFNPLRVASSIPTTTISLVILIRQVSIR